MKTTTSLSQQHNLSSDEYYERVEILDDDGKKRRAQYFDKYGDHGHQLTYFMNNSNIPSFIVDNVISKLLNVKEIKDLGDEDLNWMFTFNAYNFQRDSGIIPGFPYHVDSDFNGDVTVILSLMCGASMEVRPLPAPGATTDPKDKKYHMRFELSPGSLVLLSGEARWLWQHRTVPRSIKGGESDTGSTEGNDMQRMSLVLGCRNRHSPSTRMQKLHKTSQPIA